MLCHLTDISEPSGPKNRMLSRPLSSLSPSRKLEASMPSIGRSVGTLSDAPASAAKVVYQSWADSISSVTTPAGTFPGQRTIAGTRIEPSLVDAVHDLPDAVIHLGNQIRVLPQPRRGRLVEVRMHRLRRVHVRQAD